MIVLIDNSQPDPLSDLETYIQGFRQLIDDTACVVAVGRMDVHAQPDLEAFSTRLQTLGVLCPVLPIDVRDRIQVVQVLELLLVQLEAKQEDFST